MGLFINIHGLLQCHAQYTCQKLNKRKRGQQSKVDNHTSSGGRMVVPNSCLLFLSYVTQCKFLNSFEPVSSSINWSGQVLNPLAAAKCVSEFRFIFQEGIIQFMFCRINNTPSRVRDGPPKSSILIFFFFFAAKNCRCYC